MHPGNPHALNDAAKGQILDNLLRDGAITPEAHATLVKVATSSAAHELLRQACAGHPDSREHWDACPMCQEAFAPPAQEGR